MLSYIKKYPISLFIILTVIYLSFFKPPKTDLNEIPNLDKLVHVCMYFGMSGCCGWSFCVHIAGIMLRCGMRG